MRRFAQLSVETIHSWWRFCVPFGADREGAKRISMSGVVRPSADAPESLA